MYYVWTCNMGNMGITRICSGGEVRREDSELAS